MNDFPRVSEGILGEQDIPKTNIELFLSVVEQYFPEAIKDGEVDFTALKEELGEFAEVGSEHYDFTWAGKQAAKKEAQADLFGKSLRYKPEDSLNPDNTENLYIEGDNLSVLKLLRRNYHGKIKMIYIDPPYNTGKDKIYRDNFTITDEELSEFSGDIIEGVIYQKNSKDDAKYHTNFLNLMYPRLKLARELLTDDGVIFISIDDYEATNLKKLCDAVFGDKNRLGIIANINNPKGRSDDKYIATSHEYVLVYAKNESLVKWYGFEPTEDKIVKRYNKTDEFGKKYREIDLRKTGENDLREDRPNLFYYFYFNPDTNDFYPSRDEIQKAGYIQIKPLREDGKEGNWRWELDTALRQLGDLIPKFMPVRKIWGVMEKDYLEGRSLVKPTSSWTFKDVNSERGTEEFVALGFDKRVFPKPKPLGTIKRCIELCCKGEKNSIILDFFSGSSTSAQAVMQMNADNDTNYKYIMVQLSEDLDEALKVADSESQKTLKAAIEFLDTINKPHRLCEIAKERIRRAANKIHEENPDAIFDDGFKVFEVGKTTIRWNLMDDEELSALDRVSNDTELLDFTDGHNDTDIVYEIMLRQYGIPFSTPIEKLADISDRTYIFADAVVVCLEPEITDELIEKLADIEPTPAKFVLRDSAFGDNIEFKDFSFRKLSALIRSHQTEEERKSKYNNYTVEFI